MKMCVISLKSLSPYMQSRFHNIPKLDGEQPDAWEERTWQNKAHFDSDGNVFIPPMAIAIAIKEACKFLNKKIPGRRNETWTKHFESGVLVTTPMMLGINIKDVQKNSIRCSSDGTVGGKSKVTRHFPAIPAWKGTTEVVILDDMITPEIFSEVLATAGNLIGVGAFRVRNRGYCGRFEITSIKWK
jgi:hypothetical protein